MNAVCPGVKRFLCCATRSFNAAAASPSKKTMVKGSMKTILASLSQLTDPQLTAQLTRVVSAECSATAVVVATLAEFDARRLYLTHGYTSLFAYCLEELKLTEDATFNRIEAARAARKFPMVLDLLETGELPLTGARLLAPHLTPANHAGVLREARHKTKKEIELLVARLRPQPPVPSVVRRLPERKPVESAAAPQEQPTAKAVAEPEPAPLLVAAVTTQPPSRRPVIAPLSEAHYKLQVTISAAARERLKQIQDLMRHRLPSGDPAAIVEHALEVLHAELLKKKAAEVARPRGARESVQAKGRHIPASVKRAVWRRDQGRCAFVGDTGKRCGAAGALEFHHVDPHAHGGKATVANIEMRCRAHNGFEWTRDVETREATGIAAPVT